MDHVFSTTNIKRPSDLVHLFGPLITKWFGPFIDVDEFVDGDEHRTLRHLLRCLQCLAFALSFWRPKGACHLKWMMVLSTVRCVTSSDACHFITCTFEQVIHLEWSTRHAISGQGS